MLNAVGTPMLGASEKCHGLVSGIRCRIRISIVAPFYWVPGLRVVGGLLFFLFVETWMARPVESLREIS